MIKHEVFKQFMITLAKGEALSVPLFDPMRNERRGRDMHKEASNVALGQSNQNLEYSAVTQFIHNFGIELHRDMGIYIRRKIA